MLSAVCEQSNASSGKQLPHLRRSLFSLGVFCFCQMYYVSYKVYCFTLQFCWWFFQWWFFRDGWKMNFQISYLSVTWCVQSCPQLSGFLCKLNSPCSCLATYSSRTYISLPFKDHCTWLQPLHENVKFCSCSELSLPRKEALLFPNRNEAKSLLRRIL